MKQEEYIKQKFGKDSGMRVPEGYFQTLEQSVMQSLPPYVGESKGPELTAWQRMKPYLYLAAMFCGIGLMMKLFHTVSEPMSLSLDNPPEALVQLIDKDNYYDPSSFYVYENSDLGIEQELSLDYDSIEEFEKDFESVE